MLDPFTQLLQHCWGRAHSLRMVYKELWVVSFPRCIAGPNIVGSCCIRLHTTANMHATTPNMVGATMLGVVASVCTQHYIAYRILLSTIVCNIAVFLVLVVVVSCLAFWRFWETIRVILFIDDSLGLEQ